MLNDISQLLVAIFQYYYILKNLLQTALNKEFRHLLLYQVFEADFVTIENKQHKIKIRSSKLYVKNIGSEDCQCRIRC